MSDLNLDHLKDPDKCLEELERYRHELESFRVAAKQAANVVSEGQKAYDIARAELLSDNQVVAELKLLPNKEDREAELRRLIKDKYPEQYNDFSEAEDLKAGFDEAFKIVDTQRSIVQSAIKLHTERK